MKTLSVTVVGQDLLKIMKEKFELVGFNVVNQVNTGMLGNLKILTYFFEMDEDDIIEARKKLLLSIGEEPMRLMALFPAGDWMRIIVIKPIRI